MFDIRKQFSVCFSMKGKTYYLWHLRKTKPRTLKPEESTKHIIK